MDPLVVVVCPVGHWEQVVAPAVDVNVPTAQAEHLDPVPEYPAAQTSQNNKFVYEEVLKVHNRGSFLKNEMCHSDTVNVDCGCV